MHTLQRPSIEFSFHIINPTLNQLISAMSKCNLHSTCIPKDLNSPICMFRIVINNIPMWSQNFPTLLCFLKFNSSFENNSYLRPTTIEMGAGLLSFSQFIGLINILSYGHLSCILAIAGSSQILNDSNPFVQYILSVRVSIIIFLPLSLSPLFTFIKLSLGFSFSLFYGFDLSSWKLFSTLLAEGLSILGFYCFICVCFFPTL